MPDEEIEVTQESAPPLNAVIVIKTVDDDGTIRVDPIVQGNVQATEVQTLLELGVQRWRQRIGLVG